MTNALGIFIDHDNHRPVVSSRKVAEVFEKEHKHVMEAVRSLECDIEFAGSNFRPISYTDSMNRVKPEYLMTRDGFTLLAMGFTGAKAMQFKIKYIQAFNAMEKQIAYGNLPDFNNPATAARAWADEVEKKLALQAKIDADAEKVTFAEGFLMSEGNSKVAYLAEKLVEHGIDISTPRLFERLRSDNFLCEKPYHNKPTQTALEAGYFECKPYVVPSAYGDKITYTPYVTPKGMKYFMSYYLKKLGEKV